MAFISLKETGMAGTVFGTLLVVWLLGVLTPLTLGGLIHVLLLLAVAILLTKFTWVSPPEDILDDRETPSNRRRGPNWLGRFLFDSDYEQSHAPKGDRLRHEP
jgi:hypothetical protein